MHFKAFLGLSLVLSLFAPLSAGAAEPQATHNLMFLMAHKPENQDNVSLLKDFTDRVREKTGGAVNISLTTMDELKETAHDHHDFALHKVYTGEIAMSQISAKKYASLTPDIDVLDMPMLFKSHDHVTKVVDGRIGDELREAVRVASNDNVRGLAFTYSGGPRDIYTTLDIDSLSDLKGVTTRLSLGRMGREVMDYLGTRPFQPGNGDESIGWFDAHKQSAGFTEQAELLRIESYRKRSPEAFRQIKTIFETEHSMYLTLISINGGVMDSLSPAQQKILREEADVLARQERELSIQQAVDIKERLIKDGVKFVAVSDQDRALLQKMGEAVHGKYSKGEIGRLMNEIKAVGEEEEVGLFQSSAKTAVE